MKKLVLSALAAVALFATQASAQPYYSYGSSYLGSSVYGSGYYGSTYSAPSGPYINIGHIDTTPSYYGTRYSGGYSGYNVLPATFRSSYSFPSFSGSTYSSPYYSGSTYSQPSYYNSAYIQPTYSSSYTLPSYSTSYGLGYSSYIQPASRRVISTYPYSGYSSGSFGCRC